jgi:uncharacterized protein YybS (DUF2232 family)
MNQFKAGDTNAVVLAGMCTALAVILSMIGFYVPVLSLLGLLALPLPIAYLGIREGVKWSFVATVGIMVLDSMLFGFTVAFFMTIMFGFTGVAMAYSYKKQHSAFKTFALIVVVMFVSMIANLLGSAYLMGMTGEQIFGSTIDQMQAMSKEVSSMMASGDQLAQVEKQTEEMYAAMRRLIPSALILAPMIIAWGCMAIEKKVFTRLGLKDFPQFPPFERWHFPRIFLVILLICFGAQYMSLPDALQDVVYNAGVVCYFVLWLQGLSTLWWLPKIYPFMRKLRLIVVILSFWMPVLQIFMVYLGISDMALNYRKKKGYE